MSLFSFFNKNNNQKGRLKLNNSSKSDKEILEPAKCQEPIARNIEKQIKEIDWSKLKTAYGNAENTIPNYLKNIYCSDEKIAMDATHQLWCSLCHQHAYISTASLPSYEIIKNRLINCDDKLKVELLDILYGFACCSNHKTQDEEYQKLLNEMKNKLLKDKEIFEELSKHENEDINSFAELIIEELDNKKEN